MHHVRMGMFQLERGAAAEVVDQIRRDLVPWLRELGGFVEYDLVTTPHDGLISWSVWRTKRDAQYAAGLIKRWMDDNLAHRVIESELHIGDLVVCERGGTLEPV